MNIIKDEVLRERYKNAIKNNKRTGSQINRIIMHGTGGNAGQGIYKWMCKVNKTEPARHNEYNQGVGLFHYLIEANGTIREIIDPLYYVAHSDSGWVGDKLTIGIEHEISSNWGEYTKKQKIASTELLIDLLKRFPAITSIFSHDYQRKKYSKKNPKPCPGPYFFWNEIKNTLKDNNFDFKIENYIYYGKNTEYPKISLKEKKFTEDNIKEIKKKVCLPVNLNNFGNIATETAIKNYYKHIENDTEGGYYPVTLDTLWHGGVHIYGEKRQEVKSIIDGKIIAARLEESPPSIIKSIAMRWGSRNFILLKHTIQINNKVHTFYSLYYHLNWENLERSNEKLKLCNWLSDTVWNDNVAKWKEGKVTHLDVPVKAGDTLWTVGEHGARSYRLDGGSVFGNTWAIHWEIFSEAIIPIQNKIKEPKEWRQEKDANDDFKVDNKYIKRCLANSNGEIGVTELKKFFKDTAKAPEFRYLACRFKSEFAQNWTNEDYAGVSNSEARCLMLYNFWWEAKDAGVPLPSSSVVWHYHPVAFIEKVLNADQGSQTAAPGASQESNNILLQITKIATYYHMSKLDLTTIAKSPPFMRIVLHCNNNVENVDSDQTSYANMIVFKVMGVKLGPNLLVKVDRAKGQGYIKPSDFQPSTVGEDIKKMGSGVSQIRYAQHSDSIWVVLDIIEGATVDYKTAIIKKKGINDYLFIIDIKSN